MTAMTARLRVLLDAGPGPPWEPFEFENDGQPSSFVSLHVRREDAELIAGMGNSLAALLDVAEAADKYARGGLGGGRRDALRAALQRLEEVDL